MTVKNLHVVSRRSNAPYHEDTVYLSCLMLDHATGEWYAQNISGLDGTLFKHLSDWNAKYDTPEVKRTSAGMVADILKHQSAYGCGF